MAEFVYPAGDLDRPRHLMSVLGSFWARTYAAEDQVASYTETLAQFAGQAQLDVLDLIASMSRYTVPIWHKDHWYMVTLRESDRNQGLPSLYKFDDPQLKFDGNTRFDMPKVSDYYTFPLPPDLVDVSLIMNRLVDPSVTLTKSLDFVLDREQGALIFREDPFQNPLIPQREIFTDGVITDRECALWLFRGDFDFDTVYRQFGYVLGLRLQSSPAARDLLNAIFDAIVGGTAREQLELAFAAMTGIPLVQEAAEVVEVLTTDNNGQLVITDQHVYRFNAAVTPTVAVGDTVRAGQSLVDALEILEFNRGQLSESLPALALGRGFVSACFYSDLVFENRDVPLEVDTEHPSGYTYVKFGLGGFPLDVEHFFDELHARGIAAITTPDACDPARRTGTLAHLLDTRVNRDGEPTAADLPRTINPLKFLVANVLRNNAFAVRIKISGLGPDHVGLYNVRQLQRLIPPHTAMIVIHELAAAPEHLSGQQMTDTLTQFSGLNPLVDTVSGSTVSDARISIRTISGTCQ